MPVILPSGDVVLVTDERAKCILRLKQPLTVCCDSCTPLVVNGILCHEQGCPDAWKDETRRCKWCDGVFTPEMKNQAFCSEDCHSCYND